MARNVLDPTRSAIDPSKSAIDRSKTAIRPETSWRRNFGTALNVPAEPPQLRRGLQPIQINGLAFYSAMGGLLLFILTFSLQLWAALNDVALANGIFIVMYVLAALGWAIFLWYVILVEMGLARGYLTYRNGRIANAQYGPEPWQVWIIDIDTLEATAPRFPTAIRPDGKEPPRPRYQTTLAPVRTAPTASAPAPAFSAAAPPASTNARQEDVPQVPFEHTLLLLMIAPAILFSILPIPFVGATFCAAGLLLIREISRKATQFPQQYRSPGSFGVAKFVFWWFLATNAVITFGVVGSLLSGLN